MKNKILVILILTFLLADGATFAKETALNQSGKNFPVPANELRELFSNTQNQLSSAQEEIDKLQDSNFELKKQMVENKKELDSLRAEKLNLESQLKVASISMFSENDVVTLKQAIAAKDIELGESRRAKLLLENKLKELSNTNTSRGKEIATLKDSIAARDTEIAKLNLSSLDQLNSLMADRDNKVKQLEKEIAVYKGKIDDLSIKLVSSNNQTEKENLQKEVSYWKGKAQTLEEQSTTPENLVVADKAIQSMMSSNTLVPICYYNIGKAYQNGGNYLKALENYKKAIDADSSYGKAYSGLGIAYAQAGDFNSSIKYMKEYLRFVNTQKERDVVNNFIQKLQIAGK